VRRMVCEQHLITRASGDYEKIVRERVRARVRNSSLFRSDEYVSLHPDLAEARVDPYEHYCEHGLHENRKPSKPNSVARLLAEINRDFDIRANRYLFQFEAAQRETEKHKRFCRKHLIGVICHSLANHYMHPIAVTIAHALRRAGARCVLVNERDPHPESITCPIVVAPHEFFIFPLNEYYRSAEFLAKYIAYNTEQLPSPWFHACLESLYNARAVIDINFQSAIVLSSGFPAIHFLPPFNSELRDQYISTIDRNHPLFSWLGFDVRRRLGVMTPLADRPIDLFFAGYKTTNRTRFFVRNAAYLADKNCFLAYSDPPPTARRDNFTERLFSNYIGLASITKVVLTMHRYSVGYFEWERMVAQGFANSATVISPPCTRSPFFTPGVHYFEAIERNLDKLLKWILDTREGAMAAQAAADAARDVVQTVVTPERSGRFLLSFLARVDGASE
jgi:hypothetical protein